jgi:hypothetical protein
MYWEEEMKEVLIISHPRWEEFYNKLDSHGMCDGTLTASRSILKSMEMDVENTLEYFKENGGFCDCEVILNLEK